MMGCTFLEPKWTDAVSVSVEMGNKCSQVREHVSSPTSLIHCVRWVAGYFQCFVYFFIDFKIR